MGTMSFPMKVKYDLVKRTLPLTIRPAESFVPGDAMDVPDHTVITTADQNPTADERGVPYGIDEEDPPNTGGVAGSGGLPPDHEAASSGGHLPPEGLAKSGDAETKKRYFKKGAIGRTYEYDEHGNCIYKTPLHGSLRPPTIPLSEWQKLSKRSKQQLHGKLVESTRTMSSGEPALPSAAGVRPVGEYIPHMPCMPVTIQHRQRDAQEHPHYNACVARTVKPAEVKVNTKALAAMEMERRRLRQVPRKDGEVGVSG